MPNKTVIVYVSYEWVCPHCEENNKTESQPYEGELMYCGECGEEFEVEEIFHC